MTELFFAAIGTPQTTAWSLLVRMHAIASGMLMADSSTPRCHMTTLSRLSSGHPMARCLLLAHLKCSDYATNLDGHTLSTNQPLDQS